MASIKSGTIATILLLTVVILLCHLGTAAAAAVQEAQKCAPHYYENDHLCRDNCQWAAVCHKVRIRGDVCYLCKKPVTDDDEEQCDGIHYTGDVCRKRYGFDNINDVINCKNQTYDYVEYMMDNILEQKLSFWCYQCTYGLRCE